MGLRDQPGFPRARRQHGLANCAFFHRRRSVGDADDDFRASEGRSLVNAANEILDHFLGDVEVGDYAVAHGSNRLNRAGSPADHELGAFAYSQNLLAPILNLIGDDRRLVQNNTAPSNINQRIGRSQVDRHVI